jgi:hypothetical protein
MKFTGKLLLAGKTATGFEVPPEVVEGLGGGRRPSVRVTINGHTYSSTIAPRGERYLIGVSAENREAAGVAAGDVLEVDLVLEEGPRAEADVPDDLAEALAAAPQALELFSSLTPTQRGYFVSSVAEAKKPETRVRRVEKAVASLLAGRKQP